MAWTTPRTWTTSETVTAALMNTHVKDNLSHLITGIRSASGLPISQYKSFAYGSGQANGAGTGAAPTELTSYAVTIPGNTLEATGRGSILVSSLIAQGAAAESIRWDIKLGAGAQWSVWSSGAANTIPYSHLYIQYIDASNALVVCMAFLGAAALGAATGYVCVTGTTGLDWTADQVLKTYLGSTTAGNARMLYYTVQLMPALIGV